MRKIDLDTWEEILITLTRNKTRSILTAFGVFWGIFMLVALMGGAQGMQDKLAQNFAGFATNSGFMGANKTGKAYKGFQQGRSWDLENKDAERIRRKVPEVEVITPSLAKWGVNVIYGEHKISGTLKGLYPEYGKIEEPSVDFGRYLNDIDIRERRKVCIIGKRIYETLFPDKSNPCGKFIEINGIYYQIIGVNTASGNISVQGRAETSILIPFTTMQQNYNFGQKVQLLCYTARKGYAISEVEKKIEKVVKQAHLIHPDDQQALIILNAEVMFSMMDSLFAGIRLLSWIVGLGTLLAGAIGVSNIMMVTVKERTTEIGIRRAIGARPSDILQQILVESMVLTSLAGMTGISFAVFLLHAAESRVRLAHMNGEQAETDLKRMEQLYQKELVSNEEYEQTLLAAKQAREELQAAKDNLEIVKEGITQRSASLSSTLIRSTIDGLILDVPIKEGNSVIMSNTFNDGTTIATVADMSDLIFRGNVDETEVGRIREGIPVKITLGALQNMTFDAELEYISPKSIENNGANQFEIKAAIQVPDSVTIRSGYSANAEIVLQRAHQVLTVPESAIEFKGDSAFAYLLTDSVPAQQFKRTAVTLGISDGIKIEVKQGLQPGNRVRGMKKEE